MSSPLLSVVVPIYNVGSYLVPCLESLLNGSLRDLEVICVDDGSTDGSGEIADEYAARDSRLRVLHVENGGLGRARNIGTERATGRYLAFVDSDDRVTPRAYELLCGSLEGSGSDIASGRVRRFTDTRAWLSGLHTQAIPKGQRATHIRKTPSLVYDTTAWNKVFRRSFWDEHGLRFPEGVLYEDIPVTIPAHVLARSVDLLVTPVYEWRERGDGSLSITQRRAELKNLADRMTAVKQASDFLAAHAPGNVQRAHDRKVLTLDIPIYLEVLDVADQEFRELFAGTVREYLEHVDAATLQQLPVWDRLAFELLRRNRVEEAVQVVRARSAAKSDFTVRRKRTRLLAELPFLDDPAVGLPEDVYDVTNKLPVHSSIDEATFEGSTLRISGLSLIQKVGLEHPWSAVRYIEARNDKKHRVVRPVRPRRRPDATAAFGQPTAGYDYAGYEVRIPVDKLRAPERGAAEYEVQMKILTPAARRGVPLTRGGQSIGRTPLVTHVRRDGAFVAAFTTLPGHLRLTARHDYALAEQVTFDAEGSTLTSRIRLRHRPPADAVLRWRSDDEGVPSFDVPLEADPADPLVVTARSEVSGHRLGGPEGGQRHWRLSITSAGAETRGAPVVSLSGPRLARHVDADADREILVRLGAGGGLVITDRPHRTSVESAHWSGGRLVVGLELPSSLVDEDVTVVLARATGGIVTEPVAQRRTGSQLDVEFELLRPEGPWAVPQGTWTLRVEHGDPATPETLVLDVDEATTQAGRTGVDQPTALVRTTGQRLMATVWSNRLQDRGPHNQHRLQSVDYAAARCNPLRDTVLFQSWAGKQYSDSPRALYEEMQRQGRDEPVLWVRREPSVELPPGTPSVLFGSREYYEALATARHVIHNDAMPVFYDKRPGSRYLQTWHGTPLKRIGFDIENAQFGNVNYLDEFRVEVTKWDWLVSPNSFSTEIFCRAFDYSGPVLETGYPRNDVFYAPDAGERRQAVRARLGLRPDQRVILWAPTWREDQRDRQGRYTLPLPFDLATWDRILQPDDVLLFRGHQLIQQTVGGMLRGLRQVRNMTLYPDIQELYLAADLLITDYSSVMFDFANTRRPMVFYAWDLDHYRDHLRGFYFDFEQTVPGPVVTDVAGLHDLLADPQAGGAESERYQRFVERFCALEDGKAAQRVLSAILDA